MCAELDVVDVKVDEEEEWVRHPAHDLGTTQGLPAGPLHTALRPRPL